MQGMITMDAAVDTTRKNIRNVAHILIAPLNIIAGTRITDRIASRIVIFDKRRYPTVL
jgi:hypothetical protein